MTQPLMYAPPSQLDDEDDWSQVARNIFDALDERGLLLPTTPAERTDIFYGSRDIRTVLR